MKWIKERRISNIKVIRSMNKSSDRVQNSGVLKVDNRAKYIKNQQVYKGILDNVK